MQAAWACYPKINITWDILKNQTAAKDKTSKEQPYRPEIELVCLSNNRRVGSAFVANPQGLLQVPTSVRCVAFFVAMSFKARVADVLAQ